MKPLNLYYAKNLTTSVSQTFQICKMDKQNGHDMGIRILNEGYTIASLS